MHDFPEDAERLLALARDAQSEPTAEQRTRMRAGIAVALTASAAGAVTAHAVAQKGASALWGKLMLGVIGSALVVGAYVALPSARHDPPSAPQARVESRATASNVPAEPVIDEAPAVEAPAIEAPAIEAPAIEASAIEAPATVGARPSRQPRALSRRALLPGTREPRAELPAAAPPASSPVATEVEPTAVKTAPSLRAELALLARADTALTHDEPELALRVLAEHRQRFPQSSLQAEREALALLARCQRDPNAAALEVQHYLADPKAPLRTRLAGCAERR